MSAGIPILNQKTLPPGVYSRAIMKAFGSPETASSSQSSSVFEPTLLDSRSSTILNKEEYTKILMSRRSAYVHNYFSEELKKIFEELRSKAELMESCHVEAVFTIPKNLDIDYTENLICSFFSDLGYKPFQEPRKEKDTAMRKVTITIT
jgi:hypothetical protein